MLMPQTQNMTKLMHHKVTKVMHHKVTKLMHHKVSALYICRPTTVAVIISSSSPSIMRPSPIQTVSDSFLHASL